MSCLTPSVSAHPPPHCTALHCGPVQCSAMQYMYWCALYRTVLHFTTLHWTKLYCTGLWQIWEEKKFTNSSLLDYSNCFRKPLVAPNCWNPFDWIPVNSWSLRGHYTALHFSWPQWSAIDCRSGHSQSVTYCPHTVHLVHNGSRTHSFHTSPQSLWPCYYPR